MGVMAIFMKFTKVTAKEYCAKSFVVRKNETNHCPIHTKNENAILPKVNEYPAIIFFLNNDKEKQNIRIFIFFLCDI